MSLRRIGKKGIFVESDTDTEVLLNFIEEVRKSNDVTLEEGIRLALSQVVGAYAIAIIEEGNMDRIYLAKKGSPLVVGIGKDEYFIASDATPFLEYTKNVVYLEDEEMAVLDRHTGLSIKTIKENVDVDPKIHKLQMDLEAIEKGGFDHFMLKEIYEQPKSIRDTLRGRMLPEKGIIQWRALKNTNRNSKMPKDCSLSVVEHPGMQAWLRNTCLKNLLGCPLRLSMHQNLGTGIQLFMKMIL